MTSSDLTQKIEQDFAALARGEIRSWGHIGLLLDHAEQSGYWRNHSVSFTEWLKSLGSPLNLKEASLWRYLAAARYYRQLHQTLADRGTSSPPLDELPDRVSPENLETLAKLARVAPDDVLQPLVQQVLAGTITRAELRETWQAYRTVLAGRTARGRGVPVPKFNPRDLEQFNSMLEAQVYTALSSGGPKWIGIEHPYTYELHMHVYPEFPDEIDVVFAIDAVATVRPGKNDDLVFHGITIRGDTFSKDFGGFLQRQTPYCDFLWLARHEDNQVVAENIPDHVGLIVVHGNGLVQVVRPAQQTPISGKFTGDLAKGLLRKFLRR